MESMTISLSNQHVKSTKDHLTARNYLVSSAIKSSKDGTGGGKLNHNFSSILSGPLVARGIRTSIGITLIRSEIVVQIGWPPKSSQCKSFIDGIKIFLEGLPIQYHINILVIGKPIPNGNRFPKNLCVCKILGILPQSEEF